MGGETVSDREALMLSQETSDFKESPCDLLHVTRPCPSVLCAKVERSFKNLNHSGSVSVEIKTKLTAGVLIFYPSFPLKSELKKMKIFGSVLKKPPS